MVETPPLAADQYAEIEAIYEDVPGWKSSTVGLTSYQELPPNARAYLDRLQDVVGVPIDIISTGPDRAETIVLRNPFD